MIIKSKNNGDALLPSIEDLTMWALHLLENPWQILEKKSI